MRPPPTTLLRTKDEGDSFSDSIDRLIEDKIANIRRSTGGLKDSNVRDALLEFM
jgi:predicted CopG family antitoxin